MAAGPRYKDGGQREETLKAKRANQGRTALNKAGVVFVQKLDASTTT